MLKKSKLGYNWIFKVIIGYYNLIFLISIVLSLVFFLFCFVLLCFVFLFFGAKYYRGMIFSESSIMYTWAIAGNELGTLNIQVHNLLTVYDNLWALKFDNFSESENVISDNPLTPSVIMALCVRKSICDSPSTASIFNNFGGKSNKSWVKNCKYDFMAVA